MVVLARDEHATHALISKHHSSLSLLVQWNWRSGINESSAKRLRHECLLIQDVPHILETFTPAQSFRDCPHQARQSFALQMLVDHGNLKRRVRALQVHLLVASMANLPARAQPRLTPPIPNLLSRVLHLGNLAGVDAHILLPRALQRPEVEEIHLFLIQSALSDRPAYLSRPREEDAPI